VQQLAGFTPKYSSRQEVISSSTPPTIPISSEQVKETTLLGMENLEDVQIHDLFECHKCSI